MKKMLIPALLVCALGATAGAGEATWIHVHVDEDKADGAKVRLNLPLALVDVALEAVKHEAFREGRHDVKLADLKRIWRELKSTGDAELLRVENRKENVRIERRGDRVQVRITDSRSDHPKVHIDVPVRVIDALFSGEANDLDFKAAVSELKREDLGELIKVDDGKSHVRIWLDDRSGS